MIELYNGDCLKEMDRIDNHCVDLILCDLPYGMTAPKWDSHIDINKLWITYTRIIKKQGIIALFATQPYTTLLINSNLKQFKYCWYWTKNQGTNFFHAKRMPIRKVEEICVFGGKKYMPQILENQCPTRSAKGVSKGKAYHGINARKSNGGKTTRYPTNILNYNCVNNYARIHSAQKPLDLCEYLIKTYTDKNDLVLDNCMGSGTTGVACKKLKRNFVGIEMDKGYFEIAEQRIKDQND